MHKIPSVRNAISKTATAMAKRMAKHLTGRVQQDRESPMMPIRAKREHVTAKQMIGPFEMLVVSGIIL
jgi:hypothetical protein